MVTIQSQWPLIFYLQQLLTGKKAVLSYLLKRLLLDVDSVTEEK